MLLGENNFFSELIDYPNLPNLHSMTGKEKALGLRSRPNIIPANIKLNAQTHCCSTLSSSKNKW
jgi:hypothetical protein